MKTPEEYKTPKTGRIIGVIQARMGSSRLPGKILAPIAGRPMLEILVERLRYTPTGESSVDAWWLATTDQPEDDLTAAWGESLGLRVFRGNVEDVLSRFVGVLAQDPADWVVRVTADDPFMDGQTLQTMIQALPSLPERVEVFSDVAGSNQFPLGYIPQIARANAILNADQQIPTSEPWHRGHVLSWSLSQHPAQAFLPPAGFARPDWRWTIDTPLDLRMAQTLFSLPQVRWREDSYASLVDVLDKHPEIVAINQQIRQKSIEEG